MSKIIMECKSSSTASASMLASAKRVQEHLIRSGFRSTAVAVYAGDRAQHRKEGSLVPWNEFHQVDWDAL
ncbi:MAG: hypothetical protein F4Z15_00660 [Gammaproteobacteria bacterium]|nr:hypothetical protein [Gammaproteobacteria bacterium]